MLKFDDTWLVVFCVFVLFAGIAGMFGLWVYSIYYRVKHSPRAPMFFCPKHGMYPEKYTIRFVGDMPYCVHCFGENMHHAERVGIQNYMRDHYREDDKWRSISEADAEKIRRKLM